MPLLIFSIIVFISVAVNHDDRRRAEFVDQCHALGKVPVIDKDGTHCLESEQNIQSLRAEEKNG